VSSIVLSIYLAGVGSPELLPPPRVKPRASPQVVKKTIERTIPYIQKEGVSWIENRKCISCHYVSFMVWSLEESRAHGISIDIKKLNEWDTWSLSGATANGVEGVAQMILARARTDADEKTQTVLKKMAENIVSTQQPDGFWKAGGQLPGQKRPAQETVEVSTMWAVLAIAALEDRGKADEKLVKSREKALNWLKSAKPGVSNEWHAFRLLIEKRYGDPKKVEEQLKSLLAEQQADGGWAWRRGDASDALATGEVLYVLSVLGQSNTSPPIRKAWQFLIDTQQPDGSWQVRGTKEAFKNQITPHTSFWGTTWAAIGLSRTLDK
jgi:hypothetical protein